MKPFRLLPPLLVALSLCAGCGPTAFEREAPVEAADSLREIALALEEDYAGTIARLQSEGANRFTAYVKDQAATAVKAQAEGPDLAALEAAYGALGEKYLTQDAVRATDRARLELRHVRARAHLAHVMKILERLGVLAHLRAEPAEQMAEYRTMLEESIGKRFNLNTTTAEK